MSESLRTTDLLACCRLVSECRDLGADALVWEAHLAKGVRELVNAHVAIIGNTLHLAPGRQPKSLSTIRVGWRDESAEGAWRSYVDAVPLQRTPEYSRVIGADVGQVVLARDDVWEREAWYRSRTYNERHRPSGLDDYVLSVYSVPGKDLFHSLWVHRGVGERPFSRRERELIGALHMQVGTRIGEALASASEPSVSGLTPRQREVLDALLTGDSEKQVAARLRISQTTVHEYVAAIYRHFGVSSRGELMARFVGRARPMPV